MLLTMYHWGLHGWVVYTIVGLLLGIMAHRVGLPLTMKSCFYPLIGDKAPDISIGGGNYLRNCFLTGPSMLVDVDVLDLRLGGGLGGHSFGVRAADQTGR